MEENLGPYMSVVVALAVLLWPGCFYLWLRWYAKKHGASFEDK